MNGKKKESLARNGSTERKRRNLFPYAVILVFIALAVLLCVAVRYGIQNNDETDCIAGAHRMMFGDYPLLTDWMMIQLNSFLTFLPFRLFYAVFKGTEGIVLALRYVYVAVKMLFYTVICVSLRRYRYWGILAAVVFTTFHPIGFLSLTYYNITILCAFAFGWILFVKQKQSVPLLIAAGIVFAFCVLAEPPTALLFVGYTATVPVLALKNKKHGKQAKTAYPLFSLRSWGALTAGAALTACVVFAVLLSAADIKTILVNAPGVFRVLEFQPQTYQWEKYLTYFSKTGYACNVAAALLLLLIPVLRKTKRLDRCKLPLFFAVCMIFVWMTAELYFRNGRVLSLLYLIDFKPVPLCFLGLASYLLSEKRDKRLFAFFVLGLGFSLCMDLFSRITMGTGAIVSAPAAVLLFRQALLEAAASIRAFERGKGEDEKETGRRAKSGLGRLRWLPLALALLTLTVSECAYAFHAVVFPTPEGMLGEPLHEQIDHGPMKGLKTIPMLRNYYDAVLTDMDRIGKTHPASLLVMDFCEWGNLYLDLPYCTFSADSFESEKSRECLLYFWSLHPDSKPEWVYIPFFGCNDYEENVPEAEDKLAFMRSVCDCTVQTGEAGFLLQVQRWK